MGRRKTMGATRITRDVFYVRGLVGETRKTTIMIVAADEDEALSRAMGFGMSGDVKVIHVSNWEGLLENENLLIGFKV
jgi:hypothetical protein